MGDRFYLPAFLYEIDGLLTLYVTDTVGECLYARECYDAEDAFNAMKKILNVTSTAKISGKSDDDLIRKFNSSMNLFEVQDGTVIATVSTGNISLHLNAMTGPTTDCFLEFLARIPNVIVPRSSVPEI